MSLVQVTPHRVFWEETDIKSVTPEWEGELVYVADQTLFQDSGLYMSNYVGEWEKFETSMEVLLPERHVKHHDEPNWDICQSMCDLEEECSICMTKDNGLAIELPCGHRCFHFMCVAQWLEEQGTCPMCRMQVYVEYEGKFEK